MSNVDTYEIFGSARNEFRENNDCTVVALAASVGMEYQEAHEHIRVKCQRSPNAGVSWRFMANLDMFNFAGNEMHRMEFKCRGKEHNITLNQFCKRYPKGRFYVLVKGHALAVVDGVIHDHSYKPRRHVLMAYKVEAI